MEINMPSTALRMLPGPILLTLAMAATAGPDEADSRSAFWNNLSELCGKAFAGEMTGFSRPSDEGWLDREVVMHVRECSDEEIRIPLHVGDNRSRTWIVTRTDDGFRLKHDHRYDDGSEEAVTWYGGQTTDTGRGWRQTFPVDDYSKAIFLANGLEFSINNLWSMEVHPGEKFAYELVRPGRVFRAEFDLTDPVEAPPAPWGHE
jgi:hypothetical protein